MASQITATLPTLDFPKEVDYPTQEDWAAFSAAAELNFGILGNGWSTQMQLWKDQANGMSTELNTNASIAQGLANYQGDWISQGYTLGQTVSVSGIYYICKLNHATGQNPTTGGSIYWNLALGNWSLKADKTEVALKIDKDISPYSSKTTPVDADLIPLSDSASSFGIKKLSWANIKTTLLTYFKTLFIQQDYVITTGSATFSPTLNTIVKTGIGSLGLKIGDVISITGSTGNNKTFNIEHINGDGSGLITDNNTIIVNYEHRGTSTPVPSKRLISETSTISVTLITNPKQDDGLDWCVPASSRVSGVTYTNQIGRSVNMLLVGTASLTATIQMGGFSFLIRGSTTNGVVVSENITIISNSTYSATGSWANLFELR